MLLQITWDVLTVALTPLLLTLLLKVTIIKGTPAKKGII